MWIIAVILGCQPPSDAPDKQRPADIKTVDGETEDTDTIPLPTGDTAIEPTDCEAIPSPPGTYAAMTFRTEEDFDFDGGGYLLTQSNGNIAALDRQGNIDYIPIPGFHDPSGLRVMSTGDIALAEPDSGGLRLVYRATGGSEIVMSGLTSPNGVAVDSDGYVFVSEFTSNGRVAIVDPYVPESWLVTEGLPMPNGLALSNDESRLYILTDEAILVTERTGPTSFEPPEMFLGLPPGTSFWSLTLDVCDNLYTVNYATGEVVRIDGDTRATESIVAIDTWGMYSALRFGGGQGGWERETLYVTNRGDLFAVPIGVPGKAPVAPVY